MRDQVRLSGNLYDVEGVLGDVDHFVVVKIKFGNTVGYVKYRLSFIFGLCFLFCSYFIKNLTSLV